MTKGRLARSIVAIALLAASCSGEGSSRTEPASEMAIMTTVGTSSIDDRSVVADLSPTTASAGSALPAPDEPSSSVAEAIVPLGSAQLSEISVTSRTPIALTIGALDVEDARIEPVGVTDAGEYEVPGAEAVGWYEFGPAPGETGSAVLAAHIAFDGRDGVFRHLDDLEVGEILTITFDDGGTESWIISERAQYGKSELPFDRIFSRSGTPNLALITCGGDFDRSARSYLDNVVAYAVPVDAA